MKGGDGRGEKGDGHGGRRVRDARLSTVSRADLVRSRERVCMRACGRSGRGIL